MQKALETLERDGRLWVRRAVPERDLTLLAKMTDVESQPGERLGPNEGLCSVLGKASHIQELSMGLLEGAKPVRVVAFNKTKTMNWGVPWHQDRVIAVKEKCNYSDFSNWSKKNGVWHCEPSLDLLKCMFFFRIHIDDTNEENGCLELALGSHKRGMIPARDASVTALDFPNEVCIAKRGDVLVVKMLTLHRSMPSKSAQDRATIRVDYSATQLPVPMKWAFDI